MPITGFGIWKVPREDTANAVYEAIKMGYRLIDGAHNYGNSREAGEGVRRAIQEGLVKREDLFVTSKLWNTYHRYDVSDEEAIYRVWVSKHTDQYLSESHRNDQI